MALSTLGLSLLSACTCLLLASSQAHTQASRPVAAKGAMAD